MINKSRKLVLFLTILLAVDVIWAFSTELTKYLHDQESFQKPFLSTYIKTLMLIVYVLALFCYPPWRNYFKRQPSYTQPENELEEEIINSEDYANLSPPTYVPIKWPEYEDKGSESESDNSSLQRVVKFSKLAEVRQMSDVDASDALWSRLSYQASKRAGNRARRNANKLSLEQIAKITLYFCIVWFLENYTFQAALSYAEASLVTLFTSSTSAFTLFVASNFSSTSSNKFTVFILLAVILGIIGLSFMRISGTNLKLKLPLGVILALISVFFYASYLLYLKIILGNEEKIMFPMFFDSGFNLINLRSTPTKFPNVYNCSKN